MRYSAIILLEEKNLDLPEFIDMLSSVLTSRTPSFEIIIMANGLGGAGLQNQSDISAHGETVKIFTLNRNVSAAACLLAGLKESSGDIIIVCGSYQQITADSFSTMLDAMDDQTDIISPWRQNRVDPFLNQLQSRLFNALTRKITGFTLHDLNCNVKIFRRIVLEETELYGNMYRFLPILAARKGFRTKEIPCDHMQERGRTGFFGMRSYASRLIDILTLYFNTGFTKKPLRFFSSFGVLFFLAGLGLLGYVVTQKFLLGLPIGGRPVVLLAILFMVLGVQAASFGLLGEIIAFTHGRNRKEYAIETII